MRTCIFRAALTLAVATTVHPAQAADVIYHEPSDTYFELVVTGAAVEANRLGWPAAAKRAAKKNYHGRQGRLAIVDTSEKHQFIQDNFDFPLPTWIGLRYWCSSRMLMWVDASIHAHTAFQSWARPWHRTHIRCGKNKIPYMPVYYTEDGRWQASGSAKKFRAFLVEYPAGDGRAARKQQAER